MLKIDKISKTYSNTGKLALDNVSLIIEPGTIYGLLGANGAGKSTLIKCLTGSYIADSGEIYLDDISLNKDPISFKKRLGYVPDLNNAYERISGRQYLTHINYLFDKSKNINEIIDFWAKKFDLYNAIDKPIKIYSHGMKQKLSTISAIIHKPKLWVLDEPMTGLDPKSTMELVNYMKEFVSKGNIIIFSSHMIDLVELVCTRVGYLKEGVLISEYDMDKEGILKLRNDLK